MKVKEQTSKEYFNGLTIIHAALLVGQILFGSVAFFLISNGQFSNANQDLNTIFQFIVPLFIFGGVIGSTFFTKSRLKSINEKTELKEKLEDYRATLVIKFALLEIPSVFALVCFLLTSNYLFLGYAGLIIVLFIINRPTRNKAVFDLELNPKEKSLLEDPKAIVAEVKVQQD